MSGKDFRIDIVRALGSEEDPADLIRMIDVLAEERAKKRGKRLTDPDYRFAAKALCILFDPVKPGVYRAEMQRARTAFQRIASDAEVEERFRQAVAGDLVEAEDLRHIFAKSPLEVLGLEAEGTTTV